MASDGPEYLELRVYDDVEETEGRPSLEGPDMIKCADADVGYDRRGGLIVKGSRRGRDGGAAGEVRASKER